MMKEKKTARKVALYGILIALAMVMSFIESLIPIPFPVPGVKLGLANLVTIVGLYLVGIPGTICVTVLRVVLVGFSFGNPYSMIYGLSGSLLSLFVMALAKKYRLFSQIGISILGGVFHNVVCIRHRSDSRSVCVSSDTFARRLYCRCGNWNFRWDYDGKT